MLSRRSLVLALACSRSLARYAHAAVPQIQGCCLIGGRAADFGLRAYNLVGSDDMAYRLIPSSGDRETDHRLGRALLRLAKAFDVNPGCGFFDDRASPNALAVQQSDVPGTEGTVLFGQQLFREVMSRHDDGIAVLAIFAHEFGHIAQFHSGIQDTLRAGQRTIKLVELHADFLAGFYLAQRQAENPGLRLWSAGDLIHGLGDNNFSNPGHHGTAEERAMAIEGGYRLGREAAPPFAKAMTAGGEFVRRFS